MTDLFPSELTVNSRSVNVQKDKTGRCKTQTADSRQQTADCRLQTADCRLQSGCKMKTLSVKCRLSLQTGCKMQTE